MDDSQRSKALADLRDFYAELFVDDVTKQLGELTKVVSAARKASETTVTELRKVGAKVQEVRAILPQEDAPLDDRLCGIIDLLDEIKKELAALGEQARTGPARTEEQTRDARSDRLARRDDPHGTAAEASVDSIRVGNLERAVADALSRRATREMYLVGLVSIQTLLWIGSVVYLFVART